MRFFLGLLVLVWHGNAAIRNVAVAGATSTQALLRYTAPNAGSCNLEVSESPTYSPLVNDIDPAKFAQANSDARPGSVRNGAERVFVIGKRTAEVGSDTIRYSRALQALTLHYFRITCPSTGDTASGTFTTANIPLGNTFPEPTPSDPNQPGVYAEPTLSTSDRTQTVIDPQTGVLLRRLNVPKDHSNVFYGVPVRVARSEPGWNDIGYVGNLDGLSATVSGNSAKLYMGLIDSAPFSLFSGSASGYGGGENSGYGNYQFHIIAAVNPGGAAPANPEDAKVVACLTVDGAHCYPGSAQYEVQLSTAYLDQSFGTLNTIDLWQSSPGTQLPRWTEEGFRIGQTMCDGSNNAYFASGENYGIFLTPGSPFYINSQLYSISQVVNTAQLTLTSNCPSMIRGQGVFDQGQRILRTQTPTFSQSDLYAPIYIFGAGANGGNFSSYIDIYIDPWTVFTHDTPPVQGNTVSFGTPQTHFLLNFGVLVWKKTASADTVAIDYGSVNYEMDFFFKGPVGGGVEYCSAETVNNPAGRPGYNCVMPDSGDIYWIGAEDGDAHLIANSGTYPDVRCDVLNEFFDAKDADTYVCGGTGVLYYTKYYGNHTDTLGLNSGGNMLLFQVMPDCNTSAPNVPPYTNQQPCVVITNATPNTSIQALAAAFTANPAYAPAYDPNSFTTVTPVSVDNAGNIVLKALRSIGNTVGWELVFNPAATSNAEGGSSNGPSGNFGCVGNGNPGCIVAAIPGWARRGCRWCVIKGVSTVASGWTYTPTYGWNNNAPGAGPYYVQVIDGSANGTINYADGSTSLQPCPQNTYGATGNNCTTLTVGSEPFSPNHGYGETGLPGELGPAMLGDIFQFDLELPIFQNYEQAMLIRKVPGAQPGTWVYTLWRDINHNPHRYSITGANPNLFTACGANQLNVPGSGYIWFWNFLADPHGMNADGSTIPADPSGVNEHFFWLNGAWGTTATPNGDARCVNGSYCYATRIPNGRDIAHVIEDLPVSGIESKAALFANAPSDHANMQSHPTGGGALASPDRATYMFDGRPYRGGQSSGSVFANGDSPASLVGGQLYKFTASQLPNLELPFRKRVPTAAFTGQKPLLDISSPSQGNVLGTTGSDSYKYCVASAANECRAGSAAGDVYVNAPYVLLPYCFQAAQANNLPDDYDICVGGAAVERDAIMQVAMDKVDNDGRNQRMLTRFARPRVFSPFWTPYVLPNAKWLFFESLFPGDGSVNKAYMLAKIPPPPAEDSIDRRTFIPMSLNLPPMRGATGAFLRFGYAENGDAANFFCTSRKEACVVSAASVDSTNPFYFEGTEASSWTPQPCSSGCLVTLPGVPQRVMYYQFVYKNGNRTVYTSPVSTLAVP